MEMKRGMEAWGAALGWNAKSVRRLGFGWFAI